jgi:uncharacterized membrane protein
MSAPGPVPSSPPTFSGRQLAFIVYVLYLVGYFNGFTKLIGVIIAHVQLGSGDPVADSHYQFQIRTFWIGLLYILVGVVLIVVLVGFVVLLWWFVWSLVRNIKGLLLLNDNKPVANPTSWLFG